jgi:biopolymer transport protein ExbB
MMARAQAIANAVATPSTDLNAATSPAALIERADDVVKAVVACLALASVVTWTVFLAKGADILSSRRRVDAGLRALGSASSLSSALPDLQRIGGPVATSALEAKHELDLSSGLAAAGAKERVAFEIARLAAASNARLGRGVGVLATIGATAPFVGLFGTVWGVMNSFSGIARNHATSLAVVAPGIAQALLATAAGLAAAIPAVVIYNLFSRMIAGHRAALGQASLLIQRLVSRDLDRRSQEGGTADAEASRRSADAA